MDKRIIIPKDLSAGDVLMLMTLITILKEKRHIMFLKLITKEFAEINIISFMKKMLCILEMRIFLKKYKTT